jgi:hypothetical protein
MGIGLQGRGQDIQVQQYGIQNAFEQQGLLSQINQGNYAARTGQAQGIYGVNKENIAASYAAQQAVGQGVSDIGKATSGALSGYSNVLAGFSYGGQSGGAGQAAAQLGGYGSFPEAKKVASAYTPERSIGSMIY